MGGKRTLLSWSGGKDCAHALAVLRSEGGSQVAGLVTTITAASERVGMHDVPLALVRAQAEAAGVPLWPVSIPWPCSNQDYESAMDKVFQKARLESIAEMAFGDLFLEEIRNYRVGQLRGSGLVPTFPVWGMDTSLLARQMIDDGIRALLVCVDTTRLDKAFAGRDFDAELLADLPAGVDPCGENGEFHTFVYGSPVFTHPLGVEVLEVTERNGLAFAAIREKE
ncbi:MAG: ATPase [Candidatus Dormibacteria bacterium]